MPEIEKVRVLVGHTSPETAYVVKDYPYGSLRCTIRYWVETAEKGAKNGQQRFMSQTEDPKRGIWNKPKGSTYNALVVMYLDNSDHVQSTGVSVYYGAGPEQVALWRLNGIMDQLTGDDRSRFERAIEVSKRADGSTWERFDTVTRAMAEHIRTTGDVPTLDNGVWVMPGGKLEWIGTENADVYFAAARELVDTPPTETV